MIDIIIDSVLDNSMVVESKDTGGITWEDVSSKEKRTDDGTLGGCHI